MQVQHYMCGVYYFMNVIVEIAIRLWCFGKQVTKVNYLTFEVACWMWPTQWENMCL